MPRTALALAAALVVSLAAPGLASADVCSNLADGTACSGECTLAGTCHGHICIGPAFFACQPSQACHGAGACNPLAAVVHQDGGAFSSAYGCNPMIVATSDGNLPCDGVGCGYVCSDNSGLSYTFNTTAGTSYLVRVKVADYFHNCVDTLKSRVLAGTQVIATWQGTGIDDWAYIVAGFTATGATTQITVTEDNDAWCGGDNSCNPSCMPLFDDLNLNVDAVDVSPNLCSSPTLANGTACDDSNDCTTSSACHSGVCTGSALAPDGTTCQVADPCTTAGTCQTGACGGGVPVDCTPPDPCHTSTGCDPGTGSCNFTQAAEGAACDDGDACTLGERCQQGLCLPFSTVHCPAMDDCHEAGTCDTTTGTCSNPAKADGAPCDDGDACTQMDVCQGAVCTGTMPVTCGAADACHEAATCDPMTGTCSSAAQPDGSACSNGTCQAGTCVETPDAAGPAGSGGAGGGSGTGGTGGGGAHANGTSSGCGCEVAGGGGETGFCAAALALLVLARSRRR